MISSRKVLLLRQPPICCNVSLFCSAPIFFTDTSTSTSVALWQHEANSLVIWAAFQTPSGWWLVRGWYHPIYWNDKGISNTAHMLPNASWQTNGFSAAQASHFCVWFPHCLTLSADLKTCRQGVSRGTRPSRHHSIQWLISDDFCGINIPLVVKCPWTYWEKTLGISQTFLKGFTLVNDKVIFVCLIPKIYRFIKVATLFAEMPSSPLRHESLAK